MKNSLVILSLIGFALPCSSQVASAQVERPAIVGIANFVVKTDDINEAAKFYQGQLGYAPAFRHSVVGIEGPVTAFKVNDTQFIELSPTLTDKAEDKLIQIGFETADAQQLRDYMAQADYEVPATVDRDPDGNLSFFVADPEGHRVQFVQYMPGSIQSKLKGEFLTADRISDHMLHVGVDVYDEELTDTFYKELLGFRPLWRGGMTDEKDEWISLLVPDGDNWIEYMICDRAAPPDPQRLGVLNHVCVGTKEIQKVYDTVVSRGYHGDRPPSIGRDGRWLLHLYDKHHTRTEVMIRKPVETPCCSPVTDPYIE